MGLYDFDYDYDYTSAYSGYTSHHQFDKTYIYDDWMAYDGDDYTSGYSETPVDRDTFDMEDCRALFVEFADDMGVAYRDFDYAETNARCN